MLCQTIAVQKTLFKCLFECSRLNRHSDVKTGRRNFRLKRAQMNTKYLGYTMEQRITKMLLQA